MKRLRWTLSAFAASFLISCLAGTIFVMVRPAAGSAYGHPLADGVFLAAMLYGFCGYAFAYLLIAGLVRGLRAPPIAYAVAYLILGALALAMTGYIGDPVALAILLFASIGQLVLQSAIALISRPKSASPFRYARRFE